MTDTFSPKTLKRPEHVSIWVEVLAFLAIFICTIIFFRFPFEGYLYYISYILLLPPFFLKYGIPKITAAILGFTLIVGLVSISAGTATPFVFIKVWGGMFLSVSFFFFILKYYEFDAQYLYKRYLQLCYWAALIGLFQGFTTLIGLQGLANFGVILNKWGYNPGGIVGVRVNSIFTEPAQMTIFMAPAVFLSVYNLLKGQENFYNKYQSAAVLLVVVLSSSSTGYLGLLLIFFMVTESFKIRYVVFGSVFVALAFWLFYTNVSEFQKRVDSSIGLWVYQDYSIENTNSSSFVLYNNWHIAMQSVQDYPFFGTGLGSYEKAFDRYTLTNSVIDYDFEFNKPDGNSLLVRLITETGLIGTLAFVVILIRGFIGNRLYKEGLPYKLASNGILVMLLMCLLRQGNYFLNGLPFFVMLYFYNKEQFLDMVHKKDQEAEAEKNKTFSHKKVIA
ncbi:O-antigen ligase family protein [Halocola ammonii]